MDTITLSSSAFVPVLRSVITKALVSLGTYLVARGYMDAGAVDPLAGQIAGTLLALGAAGYAAYAAKVKNDKAVGAAKSAPGDGTTVLVDGKVVSNA